LLPAIYLAASLLLRDRDWLRKESRLFWPLAVVPAALSLPFFRYLATAHSAFTLFPMPLRIAIYLSPVAIAIWIKAANETWKRTAATVVFIVSLGCSLFLYADQFYRRPSYRLEAASRFMETLPPGSVLLGQEAPRLALGTRLQAIMAYENWFNDRDPFSRFAPDYILVLDRFGDAEMSWMRRKFPDAVARFRRVRRFPVWDTTVSLYRESR